VAADRDPLLVEVSSTSARQLVYEGTPTLIRNRDIATTVYLGTDEGFDPSGNDVAPLDPLGALALDGHKDYWGRVADGGPTVIVSAVPHGVTEQVSPALIAEQLALSGVPPTDNPTELGFSPVFNQSIAAGATYTSPWASVKQFASVFGKLFCTATAAGQGNLSLCFPQVEFNWSVAADGFDPLRTEDWFIAETPFNFTYNYINQWASPAYGDSLQLVVTNFDTEPVNLTFGLFGSYRTRVRSAMRGNYFASSPTPGNGYGSDDVLLAYNAAGIVTGNVPISQIMNLAEGPATVSGFFNLPAAGTGPITVIITPTPTQGPAALNGTPAFNIPVQTSANSLCYLPPTEIVLPRRACTLGIANASSKTITNGYVLVTAQVQPE
jgi:hypothetical protein